MSKSKYMRVPILKILATASSRLRSTVVAATVLSSSSSSPMRRLYVEKNERNDENDQLSLLVKYWPTNNKSIREILDEADRLYANKEYMEVYRLLNKLKYHNNSEVKWRIARVLYQTTVDNVLEDVVEKEIIAEAYDMLLEEATIDNANASIHKWFAVICDCHHRLQGLEERVKGYGKVLKHLKISHELNPDDLSVCYLLGKLCYDMASLGRFKRFVARTLYAEPPECSFEEAYRYLSKVEQLDEKHHIINIYLLGKTCYELKQYYKAKYYLGLVCCLTPKTECEKKYLCKAKQFMVKLEKYKLGKELLLHCDCQNYNDDNNEKEKTEDQVINKQ